MATGSRGTYPICHLVIAEVLYIGHSMSLRIYLRIDPTAEIFNRGLDEVVIEANNWWSKIGQGKGGGGVLIMIEMHNQVENALGLHISYS